MVAADSKDKARLYFTPHTCSSHKTHHSSAKPANLLFNISSMNNEILLDNHVR